jgi:hypothetical protein
LRRRLLLLVLATGSVVLSSASAASAQTRELWPGVTFEQTIQMTPSGPVVIDVLTGPKPGGTTTLEPLLSNNTVTGTETLTSLERRLASGGTYAGVNGDFFNIETGRPSGTLMQHGQLVTTPTPNRSSAGITSDGTLDIRRVALTSTWRGTGSAHALTAFNALPGPTGIGLFTPAWGLTTPTIKNSVAAVLFPFPLVTPGVPLVAAVQELVGDPSVPIPPGGAVLVARGAAAQQLRAEAVPGTQLTTQLSFTSTWPGVIGAIGGGPQIVRDGSAVFRAGEEFTTLQLVPPAPRSAVGQLHDGRIVLVAVDGRQPGWSVGLTNFQLAQVLVRLGAVTGMALDGGGSTTMAFDGALLNRPSDGSERRISTALAFAYTGVFVPAPAEVVSPNGDGVDDVQTLLYKLVSPSSASIALTAPGGSTAFSQVLEAQPPGSYPVPFPPAGAPLTQGQWRFAVTATDELGQQSSMAQSFTVNNAIGFLTVSAPRLFLPPGGRDLTVSWKMGAPARVVAAIETVDGAVVRTLAVGKFPVGDRSVVWNGLDRAGKRVKGGIYRAHLVARNAVGKVELEKTFAVRQIVGPPKGS